MSDSSANITPNIGWILRDATPSVLDIQSGLSVDVLGDSSRTTFNVVEGAAVQGLDAGASINLEAASDAFTFGRNGTTLEIRDGADNIVAQIAGGADNSTVRFADGSTELGVDFDAGELTFAGQSLSGGDRISGDAAGIDLDDSDTSGRFFNRDDTGGDNGNDSEGGVDGLVEIEVGVNAEPYEGTGAADIFSLDVVSARNTADDTQHEITGVDSDADSLRFDLADGTEGSYTLDELDDTDGVVVQNNPFDGGSTLINFGPDDNGDVISLELAGVTDASQVDIAVI